MNWKRYLQDKRVEILIFMVGVIIEAVFLAACQVETELFLVAVLVPLVAGLFCLLYDYYRKNSFYRRLFQNLDRMDQKYLVLETLESPRFYDGELLKEALYEANKSMTEHVNESRRVMREFKDFIEMWVHQVKLPVASLLLLCHNHPDENNKKYMEQIRIVKEVLHSCHHSADVKKLVKGVMIESYIEPGNQKVGDGVYGKSITDACLGWAESEKLLYDIADLI